MKLEIDHDFTREEQENFMQTLSVDELFDLINCNTGNHSKGFDKKEIIERVLSDSPEYLICANKVNSIVEQLPNYEDCKTVIEALAVQELNKLF